MITLTETRIDLSDQHTTLYYFGAATSKPLPFASEADYCGLHRQIAKNPIDYAQLRGSEGAVLARLRVGYTDNNFWTWLIGHGDSGTYPDYAWNRFLPVEARLKPYIGFVGKTDWRFKVAPLPRAVLYPFGWSTWLSLRVTGPHTVEDLADLMQFVFKERCLQPQGEPALSLKYFFNRVSDGVRADAFGGPQTAEFSNPEVVVVSTVLAKHGGSYALGALTATQQATMLRLVRPQGPPPSHPFGDHVRELGERNGLEYVLRSDRKRFIWVDHLLNPQDRERDELECYHCNTFRALAWAGHLQGLLDAAVAAPAPRAAALAQLAGLALGSLTHLGYLNASLRDFIETPAVGQSIEAAQKLLAPAAPSSP